VWPSGSARAAVALPSIPPAPDRLSTTTDLPRIRSSAAATGRAARSACPPGGNGTMMAMLRVGCQVCALARPANPPRIGTASAPSRNLRRSKLRQSMDALLSEMTFLRIVISLYSIRGA
jgi:hypothetical protein